MLTELLLTFLSALMLTVPKTEVLSSAPDLNRNGTPEMLAVSATTLDGLAQPSCTVQVLENGQVLWSDDAYPVHGGYNSVFLCTIDGEDYLLRYHPSMFQGFCTYQYELFTLENGRESIVQKNSISFDISFGPLHESFEPAVINDFMNEINQLLSQSTVLINTDENLIQTFERTGGLQDDLWWLDNFPETFTRDENASLLENLEQFQAAFPGDY